MVENIKDILVIIPAYNEEKMIATVIEGVKKYLPQADIVVVDDCSSDATVKNAKREGVKVISHTINLGDGASRQTGFLYALRHNYKFVVHLDGDGQHGPVSASNLLMPLERNEADIVIGSRFISNDNYKPPKLRFIGMRIFGFITSAILKQKITDPTSGFRALNSKAVRFYCTDIYPQNFPDADVIISSYFANFRIKEVPVKMNPSPFKKSIHSGLRPFYYVYKILLSILVIILQQRTFRQKSRETLV